MLFMFYIISIFLFNQKFDKVFKNEKLKLVVRTTGKLEKVKLDRYEKIYEKNTKKMLSLSTNPLQSVWEYYFTVQNF